MRTMIHIVFWAALIALGGRLTIPLPAVPITMQTLFVVLAGLVEGPKRGAAAAALYLAAGLSGAPVFAGGMGGLQFLARASVGFALAFPLGAALAGCAHGQPGRPYRFAKGFVAAIGAHACIVLCGFVGMVINTELGFVRAGSSLAGLLPGMVVKSALAAVAAGLVIRIRDRATGQME